MDLGTLHFNFIINYCCDLNANVKIISLHFLLLKCTSELPEAMNQRTTKRNERSVLMTHFRPPA